MSLLDEAEAEFGLTPSKQPTSLLEQVEMDYGLGVDPVPPAQEEPSYTSRVGTAAGLGLQNLAAGAKYGVEQTAATPVAVAAGTADTAANIARMTGPLGVSPQAILTGAQAAMSQEGSLLERAQAGADAILGMLKPQPISGAIQSVAPGAMEFGLPGAQAYADETRAAIQQTNQQLEANKADGGGLLLDATTGLAQMAPAVGVGLATRSPAATAAALAGPMYGQTLAEGEGDVAQRAGRAAAFTGAEFVTELPVAKLLTVPLKAIVNEAGQAGLRTALGRIGATAGKEFTQEAQTSVLQDLYDRGALDEDKSLGDMLADAGYAGLVGGIAGGVAGAPAAIATARQDAKATTDVAKARTAYEATFVQQDDGQGGTTFVDGAGNPVGDTLDEARATAARLTPQEIAGRMQATPAAEAPAAPVTPEPKPSPMQRGTPRVEPTLAAPEQPQATQTEETPNAGEPAADIPAGRPGSAVGLPERRAGEQRPEQMGDGTDLGRVPGQPDVADRTVGEAEGRGDETSTLDLGGISDSTLTRPVVAVEPSINSTLSQAPDDSRAADAKLFPNSGARQSIVEKGFGGVDVETQRKVAANMLAGTEDFQVLKTIVERIPVDVMDVLVGPQGTPQMLLDDPTVLRNLLSGSLVAPVGSPVARLIDAVAAVGSSPKNIDASPAAKSAPVPFSGKSVLIGGPDKEDSTSRAGTIDVRHNAVAPESGGVVSTDGAVDAAPSTSKFTATQRKSPMLRGKPAAQPDAAPTQEQRNEEVSVQQGKRDVEGSGGSEVRGEQAQAQEEITDVRVRDAFVQLERDPASVPAVDDLLPDRVRGQVSVAWHAPTKGEIQGSPNVDGSNDADVLGKGFYVASKAEAARYGEAKPFLLSGKFASMPQWTAALKANKFSRSKAREALKKEGYVGVFGDGNGVVWDEAAFQRAEPPAEFASDTAAAPAAAAPAPAQAWRGKKGAARLHALVSKSKDVAPDAYEDARLPGYAGEAVDAMARLFKKNVVIFRAKPGAYAPGGLLFPADPGTIYLNADANVPPAVVFMHELVHSMKRTDPDTYAKLEKALVKLLRNKEGYIARRLGGKKLTDELVTEEMIADVMADHASTSQFWSDLYDRFDDKNAWAKFVDYVRSLLSNVIDTLYPIGASNYISDFNAAYQHVVDAAYNHARAQHGDTASDGQAPLESAMLSAPPQQGSPPSQSVLDEGNAYWRAGARMWDNMNRMRIAQEKLVERGLQLRDDMNVWVRENLSRSKMRVMADEVTEQYQEPILKEMKAADLSLKQVDDYLYALHAPERNAQIAKINPKFPDGGSGMTNAEAAKMLASFTPEQTKALKSIAAKVDALQSYKLNVMEQYGLMEPADVQRLRSMYQHYVPLKTVDDEDVAPTGKKGVGNTGRGIDIRGSEVKAALGRGSRATSPLMVSFQDMARTLVRAHKNEAGNALLELTRDPITGSMKNQKGEPILSIANPSDFAEQKKRQVYDLYDPAGQFVKRYLRLSDANDAGSKVPGHTVRVEEEVFPDVPGNWWQNEEVFVTKENGVPQYIHVRDPELMAQLRRMGDAELGPAIRAIGQGTRLFARMLTQYNPVFAPVNVIRDAIQASVLSLGVPGLNPLKVLRGVLPNLGRIMTHKIKPNARYQEFLEDGASTNAYGLSDLNDALADVQALGIALGYGIPSKGKWDAAWKAINAKRKALAHTPASKSVFGALTWWNEAFENAVRLSTYNAMRDAGVSREQAAFQSKELSTNFNKKGELSSVLNAAYVFVNAAMQGNRALVKFWNESGRVKAAFAGLVLAGVLQDILGAAFGGEDEDSGLKNIDEVGDWALDHNIVLPTGQNSQVKIPIPYGLNLPFVMGRRISKAIRTGDGLSQVAGILNVMADNFSPIGGFEPVKDSKTGEMEVLATGIKTIMPSLLRPAMGVAVNSNFMGAPIAREPFQGDKSPAPRAYDFKPGTADLAVKLSAYLNDVSGGNVARPGAINISPEHIEYLVGEYSGGAGRFVSDVTDMTIKATSGKSQDIDFTKAPFVRSFFGQDSRSDAYSRYRDIKSRVDYLKDEKEAGVDSDPVYRRMKGPVERAEKRLKDLRAKRKKAYANEDMARVRQIQDEEAAIIKGVVKTFNERQ